MPLDDVCEGSSTVCSTSTVQDCEPKPLACSFCGNTTKEARKMITGPGVAICDECVVLCMEIIEG